MKEIKFRGRRKDNGEWVYGQYAEIEGKHYIICDDAEIALLSLGPDPMPGFAQVDPEEAIRPCGPLRS